MRRGSVVRGSWFVVIVPWLWVIAWGFGLVRAEFSPAAEMASFRVLDGFEVNLFASETNDVVKPIQIRFDPDGRLWVAGSVSYPQIVPGEPANDRIVVLEDRDGDGRADRSTIFADGLQIPTGLELGDGGLYVGAATELLHLRDTDGDGRADERRVVLRGFGTGDAHQTLNSFTWGPSGELLMSQGLHANSRIETPWGIEELRQAGVWRFWPRRLGLDAFWDGAMGAHNPFGNVFDRWGQPFVLAGNGHGIYHLTQAMIRTDHFLEQKALWNQGRKFGGGDFVENSLWPAANQGEVISGGYLQNSVERFRVTDDGASFKVERLPPLIETTNTAFRIVDARFGPDGALYLCDWYNPIIGHYQTSLRHPDRDKTHGRIWRVTPRGATPKRPAPMSTRSTADLIAELKSPERWNRQMAGRVLASRPTDEVSAEVTRWWESASRANPVPSDHDLFEVLGVLTDHELVETNLLQRLALSPAFPARAYAARVTGHWAARLPRTQPGPELELILRLLSQFATDSHPRVRLEAIVACSDVPDPRAVEVAATATDLPMDPVLDYAFTQCIHALKPWWRPALERGDLQFGNVPSRLTALGRADRSADTVAQAAGRLRRIAEVALDAPTQRELLQTVLDAGGPKELSVLLTPRAFTLGTRYDSNLHAQLLEGLAIAAQNRGVRPDGDLAPPLTLLINSTDDGVRAGALHLAGLWQVGDLRPALQKAATDRSHPLAQRAAIQGLAGFADAEARKDLVALTLSPAAPAVRASAAVALVRVDPQAAATAAVALLATPMDSSEIHRVFAAFLQQGESVPVLTAALTTTPPSPANVAAALELMASSGRRDPALAAVLTKVAGAEAPAKPLTLDDVPALAQEVRASGDPERGARIFQSPALGCTTCHSVDGSPGKIGPNLSALGTAQTVEFVLGALLDPQKEVKEGFVAFEITTRRGDLYQGYPRGETPDEVVLLDHLSAQVVRLNPNQIAGRRQLGSLMPAGLMDSLSRSEIRDLAAYLSRLGKK